MSVLLTYSNDHHLSAACVPEVRVDLLFFLLLEELHLLEAVEVLPLLLDVHVDALHPLATAEEQLVSSHHPITLVVVPLKKYVCVCLVSNMCFILLAIVDPPLPLGYEADLQHLLERFGGLLIEDDNDGHPLVVVVHGAVVVRLADPRQVGLGLVVNHLLRLGEARRNSLEKRFFYILFCVKV